MSNSMDTKRRTVLRAGLAVIACGVTGGAAAQQKLAQNLVQYQATPKNGLVCENCVQFQPPNACKVVEGEISPQGWCVAYAPKAG